MVATSFDGADTGGNRAVTKLAGGDGASRPSTRAATHAVQQAEGAEVGSSSQSKGGRRRRKKKGRRGKGGKKKPGSLVIFLNNLRGFNSKKNSLLNILKDI